MNASETNEGLYISLRSGGSELLSERYTVTHLPQFCDFEKRYIWKIGSSKNFKTTSKNGVYQIAVLRQDWHRRQACHGIHLQNVEAYVDMQFIRGSHGDSTAGIFFRYTRQGFYVFYITRNRHYSLWLFDETNQTWERVISYRYSSHILGDDAKNTTGLRIIEDRLQLFANGQQLTETRAVQFAEGSLGLYAETAGDDIVVEVRFSNFHLSIIE